jgi:hypothetical protein
VGGFNIIRMVKNMKTVGINYLLKYDIDRPGKKTMNACV